MSAELDVYALGNAIVDIQVKAEDSLLAELGLNKGCRYPVECDRQKKILCRLLGSDTVDSARKAGRLKTSAGGSAANTLHGIRRLGGRAGFCGKIGNDQLGTLFTQDIEQNGIVFTRSAGPGVTGTCVVLVTGDAQRTMLTCLGVSGEIRHEDIDEELLTNSRFLYLEGYLFESECAGLTVLRAVELAKANGVKIALTASDADCVRRHRERLLRLIKNDVDLLLANAREAQVISGADNNRAALRVLCGWCDGVAVTDGEDGSLVSLGGEVARIAPCWVPAVDTTGAGDAYAAGFLYGITRGRTALQCGRIASLFSAEVVTQRGARHNGRLGTELQSLLQPGFPE